MIRSSSRRNKLPPSDYVPALAFGGKLKPDEHTCQNLKLLKDHRDQAQHPEGRKPYGGEQLVIFRQKLWDSGWLIRFLTAGL
jgi:hypothetical protein